jgi:hypothetical protein
MHWDFCHRYCFLPAILPSGFYRKKRGSNFSCHLLANQPYCFYSDAYLRNTAKRFCHCPWANYCLFIYIRNLQLKKVWRKMHPVTRILAVVVPLVYISWLLWGETYNFNTIFKNEDVPLLLLDMGNSAGQIIFTFRFIYQWIYSEKTKRFIPANGLLDYQHHRFAYDFHLRHLPSRPGALCCTQPWTVSFTSATSCYMPEKKACSQERKSSPYFINF